MTSNPFNKKHARAEKGKSQQDAVQQDICWTKEIEETVRLGYSYEMARGIVSKRKIQDFFKEDRKINR